MKFSFLACAVAAMLGCNSAKAHGSFDSHVVLLDADIATVVEQSDGRATLLILDHSDTEAIRALLGRLSVVSERLRVGVGAFGPDTDEGRMGRQEVIDLFRNDGFQVCSEWGNQVYDPVVAEDRYNLWLERLGNAYAVAKGAAIIIDKGDVTTAGAELGQDYLISGVGTGEDRLLVDLLGSAGAVEVRDDLAFAQVDLLVESESVGASSWDCMKGNS